MQFKGLVFTDSFQKLNIFAFLSTNNYIYSWSYLLLTVLVVKRRFNWYNSGFLCQMKLFLCLFLSLCGLFCYSSLLFTILFLFAIFKNFRPLPQIIFLRPQPILWIFSLEYSSPLLISLPIMKHKWVVWESIVLTKLKMNTQLINDLF